MRTRTRQWTGWGAGLLVASAALVSAAWASQGAARAVLDTVIDPLYVPALWIAVSLSPNPHAIAAPLLFGAYVLQTFLMLAMVAILWGGLAGRVGSRHPG